jgi:hypothetical protein
MQHSLDPLWPWMLQTFGTLGTLLLLLVVLLLCLAWCWTPIGLWLLYRKSRTLEQYLVELHSRTAAQGRQQQVERLQRNRGRTPPRRRR